MRTPTDIYAAFKWWRDALAGLAPQITHEPQVGFFQRRFVRGGVFVPVAIFLEQETDATGELSTDERLVCLVNGKPADPEAEWSHCAGNPITEQEYRYLEARSDWARVHSPEDPYANPGKPIDLLSIPPVF